MTDIVAMLDELDIWSETHQHPPVFTVKEARAHWHAIHAVHTKNLLLKDAGGAYWLVSMAADTPIDLKTLPAKIGSKRLRFAPAEQLLGLIGVEGGAVSAFAIVNDHADRINLVMDAALMTADRIAFHPLDNRRTTIITPAGLLRFLESVERIPLVVTL